MITGKANYIMDLAAVRLASINQTLDPWLYILLRRSFFVKLCSTLKRINFKCLRLSRRDSMVPIDNNCDNDLERIVNHLNSDNENIEAQHNIKPKELDEPDVMQSAKNSNNNSSPLPDVTNTGSNKESGDSGYVCHLHFGKNDPVENEEGGIYVKIFYLRPESSFKCHSHSPQTCRTMNGGSCVTTERHAEEYRTIGRLHFQNNNNNNNNGYDNNVFRHSPIRQSNVTSNETVLSQDYNLTFHSETLGDVSKDGQTHERFVSVATVI